MAPPDGRTAVTSGMLLVLLHEGGWDEVLMVGVGLVLAYVIIVVTGRRGSDDEPLDEDAVEADESSDRRS